MKTKNLTFVAIVAALICCACSQQKEEQTDSSGPLASHVIFIGIDGWGTYSVDKAQIPAIRALMQRGAYTVHKRSEMPSSSAPNWASIFMGSNVELHGYTQWGSKTPEIPSRVILKNDIYPTIFQITRDARPEGEIGVIADWDGINYLVDTLSCNSMINSPNYPDSGSVAGDLAARYIIDKKPLLMAVVFDNLDHVGHADGHDTPEYYAALNQIDGEIGKIVQAAKEAGIYDDCVFIVTSDHGGINKGHGGIDLLEMETPFVISGKGIANLCEFSESMLQSDIAPTIARILDVPTPQVWSGHPLSFVLNKE
ncbi:MAG: alkaline phosphatase [Bacteroidales bacterium]|nr:alkaline phosphatase [Bacteroidales bacterium]